MNIIIQMSLILYCIFCRLIFLKEIDIIHNNAIFQVENLTLNLTKNKIIFNF